MWRVQRNRLKSFLCYTEPMPFGSRFGRLGQWWADRSLLERILIGVILIAIIVIFILLVRSHHVTSQPEENLCTTPVCIKEAAMMLERIETESAKPCDDFYEFSCANFRKYRDEYEVVDTLTLGKRLLLDIYKEPTQDGEHKMVKAAKRLFQACMDEDQIDQDKLKVITEVLKEGGGWPVLEGTNWDDANFDWIKTTSKLRELGYYYTAFLDLQAVPNPENTNETILMLSTPVKDDLVYGIFSLNKIVFMKEVAEVFGAKDPEKIVPEVSDAYRFGQAVQTYAHPRYTRFDDMKAYNKCTINDLQKKYTNVDWLKFINNIIGPTVQLSKDDHVLLHAEANVTNLLNLISRTSKRTQANYMLWRVVEEAIPYLTTELRNKNPGVYRREIREDICLRHTEDRLSPTPIRAIVNRRHISGEKKKQMEELLLNIKAELVEMVNRIEWMDIKDKQKIAERAREVKMVIAQPENYLDNKVLDDLDVDMNETKHVDFLSLLAQANRNRVTIEFNQIGKPFTQKQPFVTYSGIPQYLENSNTLYVPAVVTISTLFNENRPHYLNYGSLGSVVGYQLVDIHKFIKTTGGWTSNTEKELLNKRKCIEKGLSRNELDQAESLIPYITYRVIGELLSYSAYEKWIQKNGEEPKLPSVPHSPKQLFWISLATTTICERSRFPYSIIAYMSSNKNFANDFGCLVNSTVQLLDLVYSKKDVC